MDIVSRRGRRRRAGGSAQYGQNSSGGGSVVVGTLSTADEPRQAWIAELDEAGEVLRERVFAGTHGSASLTKVALLPSGGCVVGLSLEDDAAESPVFRAGLVWLDADLLPTQSAELGLGCASASIAELAPLRNEGSGPFAVRVEVATCAASGFAEIQRVDSDGFVGWRHRIVRGLGGAAFGPSEVTALPGGQIAVTLRPRSGGKASRVLLDAEGIVMPGSRGEGSCEDNPAAALLMSPLGGFPTRPLVFELRLRSDRAR